MVVGILALAATLAALVALGTLLMRANSERRPFLAGWSLTLLGISIALGAMGLGFIAGFGGGTFRAIELGGALLAPIWLALGMVELMARLVQVRFAAWLFAVSYTVVAAVIVLLDPLKGDFDKSLPKPGEHYGGLPLLLIDVAHVIAVLALVACAGVIAVRAGKEDREAYDLLMPVAFVALAGVLVVGGTRGFLPGLLAVLALAGAAALVWFGARRTEPPLDDDDYDDYDDRYDGADNVRTGYEAQATFAAPTMQPPPAPMVEVPPGGAPAGVRFPPGEPGTVGADLFAGPPPPPAPMRGLITVYTLLDGREEAFDRLVAEAVRAARAGDPETLIFTCHEVVNAPTQRIVYQLFRDEAAFADHQRRPHMARFLAESRTHVIATNVIELNLGAAKVVPPPALAPDY
ncbi:hypothetical protein DPM19_11390 [Actinomadura craniellae]|uniref:ABM domain-containing protein n=1 Tax=Actinomadura craniellae TaxID=2231787 RepID=A0A365HAK7_9ACTN|nr:antibiotic biosynthesis monooxygenase [Actinomadura craniellae]RAY15303.1 hypothetical protein DPM19_11390 [Actinomadura craniellae]